MSSCKKFIEIPPPQTEIADETVFQEDGTALAALSGLYNKMSITQSWMTGWGSSNICVCMGVYADELTFFSSGTPGTLLFFYTNNVNSTDQTVANIWNSCYNMIYSANNILSGLKNSVGVTGEVKRQVSGEALFIRAFCHFYLANLFGDIPYITTSDYTSNSSVSRTSSQIVIGGIITDLLQAKELLSFDYPGTGKRTRVNKGAATALLARVYLYAGEWANAEMQASEVIKNTSQYELLPELNDVFLKNSREAIWQIMPSGLESTLFTNEGSWFILTTTPSGKTSLPQTLVDEFEVNDLRKARWIDTLTVGLSRWYYPYKYKGNHGNPFGNEYSMVMRLAEQYLIRAEARVMQDKITGIESAASDINAIRERAGLGSTSATTLEEIMAEIEKERKHELFTEWGHRFFDLKRWQRLDQILEPIKSDWNSTDSLLPLPETELKVNANLKQNDGY